MLLGYFSVYNVAFPISSHTNYMNITKGIMHILSWSCLSTMYVKKNTSWLYASRHGID